MNYRLTFLDEGQVEGRIELGVPDGGSARYEAVFSGVAVGDGFLVVRDLEVLPPRSKAIELRGEGIWTQWTCETPGEHWSFALEAFGLRVDHPDDEIGERVPVGYDLEWEIPDHVHGELLVGRTTVPVAAVGRFVQLADDD